MNDAGCTYSTQHPRIRHTSICIGGLHEEASGVLCVSRTAIKKKVKGFRVCHERRGMKQRIRFVFLLLQAVCVFGI